MIDKHAIIYGGELMVPTSSRIDALCLITGATNIQVGEYVHISTGTRLLGYSDKIIIGLGCGISAGCSIFTCTDSIKEGLANSCIPIQFRSIKTGPVILEEFVAVGAHSVILPNITLGYGCAVGANSLVTKDIPAGEIWAGTPAVKIGMRNLTEINKNAILLKMFDDNLKANNESI